MDDGVQKVARRHRALPERGVGDSQANYTNKETPQRDARRGDSGRHAERSSQDGRHQALPRRTVSGGRANYTSKETPQRDDGRSSSNVQQKKSKRDHSGCT